MAWLSMARRQSRWVAASGLVVMAALSPAAQAQTELVFQWTPRAVASDGVGEWRLAYDRQVDSQFSLGLAFGLADIDDGVHSAKGVTAALRATHYLWAAGADPVQPYVGLEMGGAWRSNRQSSTLGGYLGARVPYTPSTDLRFDLLVAQRDTRADGLFSGSGHTVDRRGVAALRLGLGFRY